MMFFPAAECSVRLKTASLGMFLDCQFVTCKALVKGFLLIFIP